MSRLDPDLERAFAALRRQEQREGPGFAPLWQAAGRRPGRPARPRLGAAAVVVATLCGLTGLALWRLQPVGPPPQSSVPSLSHWRPATDFLLRTPGREILGAAPPLGRSAFRFPTSSANRERRPS